MQNEHLDKFPTHPRDEPLIALADGYARLVQEEKAAEFYDRIARDVPVTVYAKKSAQYKETGCSGWLPGMPLG